MAVVAASVPSIAAADVRASIASDPQWRAVVADFRTKHAAWTATINLEDDQADTFREACASIGPEPQQPDAANDGDILDKTLRELRDACKTPAHKAAWAAYEQDHDAWKKKRDALRERIVGPAKAQHDAAFRASSSAFAALADYPVQSLVDLGEKIEIIAADHAGGELPLEYLASVHADVRRLSGREG